MTDPPKKFVLGDGPLKSLLCNAGSDGKCQFAYNVVLTSNLNCVVRFCIGLKLQAKTTQVDNTDSSRFLNRIQFRLELTETRRIERCRPSAILNCSGLECGANTLRVVEVDGDIHYE